MHSERKQKRNQRDRRRLRVRKKFFGTAQKPRLCVVKTNRHLEAQLIDDQNHHTIAHVSTFSKEMKNSEWRKKSKTSAGKLGEKLVELAKKENIQEIIFDRGASSYHGLLAEFARVVREGGLQF